MYPTRTGASGGVKPISWDGRSPAVCKSKTARPKAVIPVFPGTNCEYDTARACLRAGMEPEIVVVRNLTRRPAGPVGPGSGDRPSGRPRSMVLPGGFSGGDEPDGSAKFICSFFRNPRLTDAVHDLLKNRDGLMLGICNGFQALVKLGLVPYGEIRPMDESCPTLTFNDIGRHQSRYVTTRVASVNSPWMLQCQVGDLHAIPVSHGEGKFVAPGGAPGGARSPTARWPPSMWTPQGALHGHRRQPQRLRGGHRGHLLPGRPGLRQDGPLRAAGGFCGKKHPGDKFQPIFESGAAYFQ